jgi:hypothetical protein
MIVLGVSIATLVIVLFIAVLLVRRHGQTLETKSIRDDISGLRQQWDVEHGALRSEVKHATVLLRKILERFGFLKGGNDP